MALNDNIVGIREAAEKICHAYGSHNHEINSAAMTKLMYKLNNAGDAVLPLPHVTAK